MRALQFENGWYCDSVPSGAYVAQLATGNLIFNGQPVPACPAGALLQLRINHAGTRFAGIGHTGGHAFEWAGQWIDHGQSFGPRAVIYDANDNLVVVREAGTHTGSIGWRYVDSDGHLVASWETYSFTVPRAVALGLVNMYEWTNRNVVTIGQGNGGVHAQIGQRRVRLAEGVCTFVNYNQVGDALSVAWVLERPFDADHPAGSYFLWLTRAELDALPTFIEAPEPPIVIPPIPPVDPPEVPPVMELPNELETVRRVAAENRHLLEPYVSENRGIFVQKVLAALNNPEWGHVAKTAGEGQYTPPGFEPRTVDGHRITGFAEDAIFHRGAHRQVDIALGNQSGGEWVWWGVIDPANYRSNNPWMPRVPLEGVIDPPPTPPPPTDLSAVMNRVTALEEENVRLTNELREQGELHWRHIQALEQRPSGGLTEDQRMLLSQLDALQAKLAAGLSTGRAFGHTHTLKWPV